VRNNLSMPEITLKDWRFTITGEIKRSLTLTMEDLKKFPQAEILATLECYGNRRVFLSPRLKVISGKGVVLLRLAGRVSDLETSQSKQGLHKRVNM